MKPTPTGFPRGYRLNDPTHFSRVFESATLRRRSGPLRLLAAPNTMQTARLGLVIGKRALRRAVDRNRAKRLLRETFRIRRLDLPCIDIVVQLTGPVGDCDLSEVFSGLLEELRNFDR